MFLLKTKLIKKIKPDTLIIFANQLTKCLAA